MLSLSFASKFSKEIQIVVIVIFCFGTLQPKNLLSHGTVFKITIILIQIAKGVTWQGQRL